MWTLVHLRHSEREAGGVHVTSRGLRLAAELGGQLGRFDRVVTSPKPRAVETAEGMGLTVDATLPELGTLPGPVGRCLEREDPRSFGDYLGLIARVEEARAHALHLARLWVDELYRLPDGSRLLLVSHGGVIELGTAGALGRRVAGWGPTLGLLEGVELQREGSRWGAGRVLRHPH